MELSLDEAFVLLCVKQGEIIPDTYEQAVTTLVNAGLIYTSDPSIRDYQLTTAGKHRVGNHMLKERNIPDYISKYSFPEAFDKFFQTSSPNAVNALCMSLLNSKKLIGVHPVTLKRLKQAIEDEQSRQKEAEKLSYSFTNKPNNECNQQDS